MLVNSTFTPSSKRAREKVALQAESRSVPPVLNIFIVLLRGDWMKQHSIGQHLTITLRIMLMDKTSEMRGESSMSHTHL